MSHFGLVTAQHGNYGMNKKIKLKRNLKMLWRIMHDVFISLLKNAQIS